MLKFDEFLFESAPRIPTSDEYWKKKGKSGKDVCLVFHDDLDGVTSAIIVKNYLLNHGFKIKQYGVINYQEGWEAFRIDSRLITIALDFAEDIPGISVYIDHHGVFTEEERLTQKRPSIKTQTGSAAEGIARELGMPFSSDIKDWIDMIDSAKYSEYDIDIKGILDFDLKLIKQSPKAKLKFAAAMNQLLKRSDHKTFIEVVNACDQPSIFNIYRLFKIFYPENNPDWKTGVELEFVDDAKIRLSKMELKTRGTGGANQGFDEQGNKVRYTDQQVFWHDFAVPIKEEDDPSKSTFKLKPTVYQLIGNLMYVPSGTWANALRAKAIFVQDLEKGIVPDDPKLNFVLLQYGNTLQVADLRLKITKMEEKDLPKTKDGKPIKNLGKYMESLVKNFETYLGYQDERTVAGGHDGIGTISNIFGTCRQSPYDGAKYLDMFKNKVINDISGVDWGLKMPWNEEEDEDKKITVKPEEINKKLVDIEDVRSEESATTERKEREILNYIVVNGFGDFHSRKELDSKFKDDTIKKIYKIWLETHFDEIVDGTITIKDLESCYFRKKGIEDTELFNKVVDKFKFDEIYAKDNTAARSNQRKQLKRVFRIMFNMLDKKYIKSDTEEKVKIWNR